MYALDIQDCCKTYPGGTEALKGLSLRVQPGEFMALLGPNGAGKSTLIGILTSLVNKDAGTIKVFGFDLDQQRYDVKEHIAVVPQEFNCHIFETVWQIVINQAGYYGVPRHVAKARAERHLKALHLWDKRHAQSRTLSGGMKRRLMIARALMHDPQLLILDEPTAGVDIAIRRQMWAFLKQLNEEGMTILLTTHYLEEAEHLCERTAIIHHGELLEDDRTDRLLKKLSEETLVVELAQPLSTLPENPPVVMRLVGEMTLEVDLPESVILNTVFNWLDAQHVRVSSMHSKSNRLETFFLKRVEASS